MSVTNEDIEALITKIKGIEETTTKILQLLEDAKSCQSEVSKQILVTAVKKLATPINEFQMV